MTTALIVAIVLAILATEIAVGIWIGRGRFVPRAMESRPWIFRSTRKPQWRKTSSLWKHRLGAPRWRCSRSLPGRSLRGSGGGWHPSRLDRQRVNRSNQRGHYRGQSTEFPYRSPTRVGELLMSKMQWRCKRKAMRPLVTAKRRLWPGATARSIVNTWRGTEPGGAP